MRLGDLDALRKQMKELLDLAVKRVNDTPNNSPCYRMYVAQESERARLIDLIDKAPTVEPFEPDYVGAERLKARQRGYEEGYRYGMKIGKGLNPKIKQGEWVVKRLQNGFEDVICPFCNARPTRSEYGYYLKDNFCHECGADMRKGGTENGKEN